MARKRSRAAKPVKKTAGSRKKRIGRRARRAGPENAVSALLILGAIALAMGGSYFYQHSKQAEAAMTPPPPAMMDKK